MVHKTLWVIALSTALMLNGCETQEQPAAKTEPHQVVKPANPIMTEEAQPKPSADKIAQAVAEQAEKIAEQTAKVVEKEVIKIVEEQTGSAVETKAQTITKVIVLSQEATAQDEIVLEASYGNVTLPHAMHAEAYDCSTCHGESTPTAFELDKETAHKVCKGCHKDEGAGPTGCKGCHVK